MKKLFKLLSLIRLVRELRHGRRGRYGGYRHGGGYPPPYGRSRKFKLKHVVRDLILGRRY